MNIHLHLNGRNQNSNRQLKRTGLQATDTEVKIVQQPSQPKGDINGLLTEYNAIKAEEIACEQSQISIATTLFSFIAAVLGLNLFFGDSIKISEQSAQFLILGACFILVMFFGCLWMHQLYCQMRFGAYLYHLENDINQYYEDKRNGVYFEHWIIGEEKRELRYIKNFPVIEEISSLESLPFFKTSWLYGGISFCTWCLAPILLGAFSIEFFHWDVLSFYFRNGCLRALFFSGITVIYYFVLAKYLCSILFLKKDESLKIPRTENN